MTERIDSFATSMSESRAQGGGGGGGESSRFFYRHLLKYVPERQATVAAEEARQHGTKSIAWTNTSS